MTIWRLIRAGLLHDWRQHLGVLLGAAVATAVLTGALVVGDSVRATLRGIALQRLGDVHLAVSPEGRMFRAELANDLSSFADTAAVLAVPAAAQDPLSALRADAVTVIGVDPGFWRFGARKRVDHEEALAPGSVILNRGLADRLQISMPGNAVLLRMSGISALGGDAPLSRSDAGVVARLPVTEIIGDEQFGRFSLRADQRAPLNAFVDRDWLADRMGRRGRANLLLMARPQNPEVTPAERPIERAAAEAVRDSFTLADAELELRQSPAGGWELRSERVFLDPAVVEAAAALPGAGLMTYFVNELRHGDRATPYSTVAGVGAAIEEGRIEINAWLAEDLDAGVGDELAVAFYVLAPGRRLEQRTARFTVSRVVAMDEWPADEQMMPDFPGLADADHCRDWEPGFDIDLSSIRPKDERYWERYHGTPKAMISLADAQRLWSNRYGDLTAVRFDPALERDAIESGLLGAIDPASLGFTVEPVRVRALAAARRSFDFGQLFLGLGMFLIVSALLLLAMLFVFGIERRAAQVGLLLAVGFTPRRVRRVLIGEGLFVAVLGSALGVGFGLIYARLVLWGFSTVWRDAVAAARIHLAFSATTLAIAALSGVALSAAVMWLTLRRAARQPARRLLAGSARPRSGAARAWPSWGAVVIGLLAAGLAVGTAGRSASAQQQAGSFFAAGAALLLAAVAACHLVMVRLAARRAIAPTLAAAGRANMLRRRGRSLTAVALLACGCFMVVAVQAFRHDPAADAHERTAGTGGFALVGESSLPIHEALDAPAGRRRFDLDPDAMRGVSIVPMRAHAGDEASCLNLNRAQKPRLLGVEPALLVRRGAFRFVDVLGAQRDAGAWSLLSSDTGDPDVIPAIADQPTLTWALRGRIGDEFPYVDQRGRPFRVRIVGVIGTSILQGNLIVDEARLIERYPNTGGYRLFLIDSPGDAVRRVRIELGRALSDQGFDVAPATERLAAFFEVENTYLSIFLTLGGLGLLLGTGGLGVILLRNLLERRGELAMMRAVGFERRALLRIVRAEHLGLLLLGVASGTVAALLAIWPTLAHLEHRPPYGSMALLIAALLVVGAACVDLAARWAMSGELLDALRQE